MILTIILTVLILFWSSECREPNIKFPLLTPSTNFQRLRENARSKIASLLKNASSDVRWIIQPLDHFNKSDTRSWRMRYFQKLDFWQYGGPIYIYIGGESEADDSFLNAGIMHDLAQETGGALYGTEHRFYGESMPLPKITTSSLRYLNSLQALADVARFIGTVKRNNKVVVVGGSYSGNLAAWMRLLYPNLVDAAIASSAPLLAKENFFEYMDVVTNDYEKFGTPGCLDAIRKMFQRYVQLLQSKFGRAQLTREENICSTDMSISLNQQFFFESRLFEFQENCQNGKPEDIKLHCDSIMSCEYQRQNSKNGSCVSYNYEAYLKQFPNDSKPWVYQTCNEFGYFVTLTSLQQPFTNNVQLDYFTTMCNTFFGKEFIQARVARATQNVNDFYGGLRPNVTKVVFAYGEMDPWQKLGAVKGVSVEAPAIYIPRSSHCMDLYPSQPDDSPYLKSARIHIKNIIKNWIGFN